MADYGVVYIDECLATTKNNVTQHGGQGTSITMVQGGKDKSTPTLETKDLIKLTYDR